MAIVSAQVEAVQKLYVAYFNRPADVAGLDYWTNIVANSNGDTSAVSANFATSKEYTDAYANMSNADIVNKVYQNLFGRAAEDAGKKYWADLLDSKQITIDNVVAQIAKGAQTTDAEAYENKVAGATAFTNALDTDAEAKGYSGDAANALGKTFLSGITTDASLTAAIAPDALATTVAAAVAAGTPFTLAGAMANLLGTQEAKSALLEKLAANDDVAAALGDNDSPTDAQILDAIKAVQTKANGDVDAFVGGFSTHSALRQTADISDEQKVLNTALTNAQDELKAADAAVAKVPGLAAALATYNSSVDAQKAAEKAAQLADNAEAAALANFVTLSGKAIAVDADNNITAGGTVVLKANAAGTAYSLATGVTEKAYAGVTAYLAALNADLKANAALGNANDALEKATIAADILDTADNNAGLKLVAADFVFTKLGTDVLPTYQQILDEQQLFADRLETLDDVAAKAGLTDYAGALTKLKADLGGAADAAAAKVVANAAVAKGYISSADATKILAGYDVDNATGDAAVDDNNYQAHADALAGHVDALVQAETAAETGPGLTGLGDLSDDQVAAAAAVKGAQTDISDFADAVAAYQAAQGLAAQVTAADASITAATKVITGHGYATPVFLDGTSKVGSATNDIFVVGSGSAETTVRSFGVQGQDTVYVGTELKYNDAKIGSDSGEVALTKAGDNAVLEFFLQATATGVDILIEDKAFASSAAGGADITTIHLVGVDLADITVDNGFITVGKAVTA